MPKEAETKTYLPSFESKGVPVSPKWTALTGNSSIEVTLDRRLYKFLLMLSL